MQTQAHRVAALGWPFLFFMSLMPSAAGAAELLYSTAADRSAPLALEGTTVRGDIYAFTEPSAEIAKVVFYLDDLGLASPVRIENLKPFDFAGTAHPVQTAYPFDTTALADGLHTISAQVLLTNGSTEVVQGTFTVANDIPALSFTPTGISLSAPAGGGPVEATARLATEDGQGVAYSLTGSTAWLTISADRSITPATVQLSADPSGLASGVYKAAITASAAGYADTPLPVTLTVAAGGSAFAILNGADASRSSPTALNGDTLSGNAFIHIAPETGLSRVEWFIDNPGMVGAATKIERFAPWDFGGTATDDTALPFDTTPLADGTHTMAVRLSLTDGSTQVLLATFAVNNGGAVPQLTATPTAVQFSAPAGSSVPATTTLQVATSDGATPTYAVQTDAGWLSTIAGDGTLPDPVEITADPSGLAAGAYTGHVTISAGGYANVVITVSFQITNSSSCSPLPCGELLVDLPYQLDFNSNHGKILDRAGTGTGFTYVQPTSAGSGYLPANLFADTAKGELVITTTAGLFHAGANSQDNALGVGIDAPSQVTELSTTLVAPPAGNGNYQQAGLWFGIDEDNYVKLVVVSTPSGMQIQHFHELDGQQAYEKSTSAGNISSARVTLSLTLTPSNRSVASAYRIDGGQLQTLGSAVVSEELFSFDAAGIDPTIGTRSFGGIFASHRNAATPLQYRFDEFAARAIPQDPGGSLGDLDFVRTSHSVPNPTSMVWGPDGRLYVSSLFGHIQALTYGPGGQVTNTQAISSLVNALGNRLTLGITIDPRSTAQDIILWVAHSSPSIDNGVPNSGMVTRLSGAGFGTVEHVITGLPRAKANHATNSIHFGPDGRLYLAQGGNTGAGAPNLDNTEFGTMEEQPLSAALLVADVYAPGFDGSCNNPSDIFGPPPCDVEVYASGLRNAYDFVFHSNGQLYGPDNGLGVAGSFPPTPTPPCFGYGSTTSWTQGGNNPGAQPDVLNRLEQGMYYGHPNPYRGECVFKDGSYQSSIALPNWREPLLVIGDHTSSNGSVEYLADSACGALKGELLITNYSVGDNIVRIRLSNDGRSVISSGVLASGFNDPLPIATTADGRIAVGEFGGNLVTLLRPVSLGCWRSQQNLPVALLDSAGAAIDGKLYTVGGKTSSGHVSSLYIYDSSSDTWSQGPNLPGPAVENPAVAVLNGKLYAFGGSTAPFSGAVSNVAVYDPTSGTWTPLAAMTTARGGAAAQALGGRIYVVGGMAADGSSVATVEVYDPATNSWSSAAPLPTRRDNPGAAVLGGKLYVFGGRTRNANGTEVDGTLAVVEAFDPASSSWSAKASMPTGRRTMVVGLLNGRAQLMGGERTADGKTFPQNEEYDPLTDAWRTLAPMQLPRHGAAGATIGDRVYVAGGGPQGGSSYSDVTDSFGF